MDCLEQVNIMDKIKDVIIDRDYTIAVPHSGIKIETELYSLDNWNKNEYFRIQVDDADIYVYTDAYDS